MNELITHLTELKYFKNIKFLCSDLNHKMIRFIDCNSSNELTVSYDPTYNCQTISIGYIIDILHSEDCDEMLDELLYIIKALCFNKHMILLDTYSGDIEELIALFTPFLAFTTKKDGVILNQSYRSTSDSDMALLLLHIDWNKVK